MRNIAIIPIHLDGLFVSREMLVTEAQADFSRLPYSRNGDRDINPDTANLSEPILSVPFENNNLNLSQGLHLHWSLPDGLTRGEASGEADTYPAVPNRWLVTRQRDGRIDRQWVVESDYLHPEGEPNAFAAIAYPMVTGSGQPFRYLGRAVPYDANWEEDTSSERLPRLTAIGYGEPSFAAFYPNCHSVFGLFDSDIEEAIELNGITYQVIGWYSDGSQDPLAQLIANQTEAAPETLQQLIRDQFGWTLPIGANNRPEGMACFAELIFNIDATAGNIENEDRLQPVSISIGNTGTEALSAYVANQLNPGNKQMLEDQLENLLLQTGLRNKVLDLGPRFIEARHEKGFKAESGGSLWEVRPANEDNRQSPAAITLPPGMVDSLSALNRNQQQYDRAREEYRHNRQLIFADWYKYMVCAYPPADTREAYPDVDLVRYYIEQQRLPLLQQSESGLEALMDEVDASRITVAQQVDDFNGSMIDKTVFFRPLVNEAAGTDGLLFEGSRPPYVGNAPFSPLCLDFDGLGAYASLPDLSGVKGLSVWVNMATQNTTESTLLATENLGALVSKGEVTSFWSRFTIDGKSQHISRPVTWHNLPKDRWVHLYIEFAATLQDGDTVYLFGNGNAQFFRGRLAAVRVFGEALTTDEIFYDHNMLGHERYDLQSVAAPRFYQPQEPVVLLEGAAVTPTLRHGEDGRLNDDNSLSVQLQPVQGLPLTPESLQPLSTAITALRPPEGEEAIGFNTWTRQPWHPFLLEWEVEVFPVANGGNLNIDNARFSGGFINDNFILNENQPELSINNQVSTVQVAAIYRGRAILTPYARQELTAIAAGYLDNLSLEDSFQVIGQINEEQRVSYNERLVAWLETKPDSGSTPAAFESWYLTKPVYNNGMATFSEVFVSDTERFNDFTYTIIRAYAEVEDKQLVSQALGGFNNALLMQHQTLQLPVSDPVGFNDYREFTQAVAQAIGDNNNLAPLPLNDFLPIRTGAMRLHRIRVIDTFGQSRNDIPVADTVKSEPLTLPDQGVQHANPDDAWLPPRLVQPARIDLRWLSAANGAQQLNTHPGNSPICGWLLANRLDNSLSVYAQDGTAIGIIDRRARWRPVPGRDYRIALGEVDNPYLSNVLQRLALTDTEEEENDQATLADKQAFLQDFITVMDNAMDNIDPETFMHHQELALLMGRPVAVVRASVNLEIKGGHAIHQGWTTFHRDLARERRETDGYEHVKVPVRIGERGQLNDGVVGYWKEEGDALGRLFHTTVDTVAAAVDRPDILGYEQDRLAINQSLTDAAQALTMLVDPRAQVHATTGLLPAKAIDIPRAQYTEALANINLTFLSAPILTGANQVALPLPNEVGYEWSWLARQRFNWREVARSGVIQRDTVLLAFENGTGIWQELLAKGWITPIDGHRASIVPTDQRAVPLLDAPFNIQAREIQQLLDNSHILAPDTMAKFNKKQRIIEGWLKLSQSNIL